MSDDPNAVSPAAGEPGAIPGQPAAAVSSPANAAPPAAPAPGSESTRVADGYFAGSMLAADQHADYAQLGTYLESREVPSAIGNAALAWFQQNAGQPVAAKGSHTFDLSGLHFENQEWPYIHAFAVDMKKAGANESQVRDLLGVYEAALRLQRQESASSPDIADRDALFDLLRNEYGPNARSIYREMRAYAETLPADQREVALETPAQVREFVDRARAATPAVQGKSQAEELAQLRKWMGSRSSPYWRGKDAARNQARYRELLAKGAH